VDFVVVFKVDMNVKSGELGVQGRSEVPEGTANFANSRFSVSTLYEPGRNNSALDEFRQVEAIWSECLDD